MKFQSYILCFMLVGVVCNSFGQDQKMVDSLLYVLKIAKEDTGKVNTLNALGRALSHSNPDTSIILANQALSLSEKVTSKKHIADSYFIIAVSEFVKGNYNSSLENNLKALSIREVLVDKRSIAESLDAIGNVCSKQGDYTKAMDYYLKALKIDEALKNEMGIASVLRHIGSIHWNQGDFPKALDYYFRSLKMAEGLGDKDGIASALANMGLIYYEQGDYLKALDYYFKVLKMDEEAGNRNGIAGDLNNIGLAYSELGNYATALDFYFKALQLAEQLKNKGLIAYEFGNIGLVYYNKKDYPTALDYYFKALKLDEDLGYKKGVARHLGNIANIYHVQSDFSKALDYYFKSLKMKKDLGDRNAIAITLGNIAQAYTETGKFAAAEKYLKNASAIADSIGAADNVMRFEESLSRLYDTTGRYKLALEHYKKAMVLKDTLFNEERDKQITRKEMNYEFEKTQAAEKTMHEKQLAVADVEVKKQKLLKNAFIGGLALTLLLFFFGYRFYRSEQVLRLQTIRNKISGDLHDDIGSTLNSISIYSEVAKKKDEQQDEALEMIGDASRKIIDAMSDIVWTINPDNDSFAKIIFRMKSLAYNLFRAKQIEYTFQSDDILHEKKLSIEDRRNFYLIFKEAVNNVVKYANATRAAITLTNENDNITLRIQDDGVGFDTSQDMEGNGIKSMKRRADEMKARFTLESGKGDGTLVELMLKA